MMNGFANMNTRYDTKRVALEAIAMGLNAHTLAKKAGVNHVTTGKVFRGGQVTGTTLLKIVAVIPNLDIADLVVEPSPSSASSESLCVTIPLGESVQTADGPELQTREARP